MSTKVNPPVICGLCGMALRYLTPAQHAPYCPARRFPFDAQAEQRMFNALVQAAEQRKAARR